MVLFNFAFLRRMFFKCLPWVADKVKLVTNVREIRFLFYRIFLGLAKYFDVWLAIILHMLSRTFGVKFSSGVCNFLHNQDENFWELHCSYSVSGLL